ncbi:bifunctional diaminohydroxyphosphoribosylaminopyrimidine deaminase/5-amino-6-(5-phosphoribosylamino)uracil reductase RibD [Allofrancisella guangzhouensis]|uniref:Riboflavin biosynthesis protein RibD n=1 Tax=Allofrancisella guangzhouensis TaxID=594679 RepID=A0A0A8E2Z6_9GAMM|nr:bifunctional diaminohydroxyphosphoribosylaminopyrimidine deaminase/5-amino-6-(5-phosphoribosylamino)uracil reductase RibD [Allofrancisella guangzhouensis]AJC48339.1 pyrimidine reductase [Allofrancisella guangzhouensis]MBK2026571.1 bifunctional diaminohydroxyphosphoribosylaminopyrimidine deaminase/5-amino-6-(5-phosphoribosylamino)uracil reductase RibD [Allofrancisella guangzhouensis]MBK2044315.1 bifunctional diaminohydroxyphosphoribosylaminopyrimidine deaminase/5-amino-6-(5-phosphoribosylamino
MKNIDQYYMQQALALAARGKLTVSPNPMVGCIAVKNGKIIAEGWHVRAGQAHAECLAIKQAGEQIKGSTIYVTLEPCCYTGKTGPCTNALIEAQVKEVVIATLDPNPQVSGKGIRQLKEAGIKVKTGILEKQAQELNKIFFYYQQYQTPYVFAKWAMSLDGKTTVNAGDSRKISSDKAAIHTHQLRNICDAIIVGKNTLFEDNPKLNVRLDINMIVHPIKIIVFTEIKEIDLNWQILDQTCAKTVFVCSNITNLAKQTLQDLNIEFWIIPAQKDKICINSLLKKMADAGITSVLLEGGMKLIRSFATVGAINEFITYVSPVLVANSNPKKQLVINKTSYIGCDLLINSKIKDN